MFLDNKKDGVYSNSKCGGVLKASFTVGIIKLRSLIYHFSTIFSQNIILYDHNASTLFVSLATSLLDGDERSQDAL